MICLVMVEMDCNVADLVQLPKVSDTGDTERSQEILQLDFGTGDTELGSGLRQMVVFGAMIHGRLVKHDRLQVSWVLLDVVVDPAPIVR